MTQPYRPALAAALAMALAGPALASIPGDIDQRARSGLLHVCVDTEPDDVDGYIVCSEQEGGDVEAPYTGSECVGQGLPAACVIDFVPKVRLKGTLLIVNDDTAFDSNDNTRAESAIVLALKKGKKKATLIDLYDDTAIGNWNGFTETFLVDDAIAIEFTNGTSTAFQFANRSLEDLGLEVRDLAIQWFPNADLTNTVAVLKEIVRDTKQDALVHDGVDTLASAASFKIVIEFARVRP